MTQRVETTAAPPSVAIVVLNWNGKADTLECLASLEQLRYPNVAVVVVDNASSDGSVVAVREAFPSITVLESGANLGYAGGNNVGIRYALDRGAGYVLLLNNDTVVDPEFLSVLVAAAEDNPRAACVGPKIYYAGRPDVIWFAGARWDQDKGDIDDLFINQKDSAATTGVPRQSEYVCGCAMLIRSAAAREIGLLDEAYYLVFEDVEWCSRARERGYQCLMAVDARIWHKVSMSMGGHTSPMGRYFHQRNLLFWAERYLTRHDAAAVRRQAVSRVLQRLLFGGTTWPKPYSLRQHYWTIRASPPNWRSDDHLPRIYGIIDYWLRRRGDCPPRVRRFVKRAQDRRLRLRRTHP